jgi:hypothetical protein
MRFWRGTFCQVDDVNLIQDNPFEKYIKPISGSSHPGVYYFLPFANLRFSP